MKSIAMLLSLLALTPVIAFGGVEKVGKTEEGAWVNYTLPLPHKISITKKNVLSPENVSIKVMAKPDDIVKNAANKLKDFIKAKTGHIPDRGKFEIILGVVDKNDKVCGIPVDTKILKSLSHKDQAYLITPTGDDKLIIAALNSKGVFYGAMTLKQMLSKNIDENKLEIPLAHVTDWPDFDERGVWCAGWETPGFIPWIASLKLNFTKCIVRIILEKGAKAQCSQLPLKAMKQAHDNAVLLMPHVYHFDYWVTYFNLREKYPELVGKGEGAINPFIRKYPDIKKFQVEKSKRMTCPCMATPLLKRLVTEWLESAAEKGATEVALWLSEFTPCQCECDECLKDGRKQYQKETKACVEAIQTARLKYPDLQCRIFFTLTGKAKDEHGKKDLQDSFECLSMVPEDIKIEKVYGRNKAFDEFAAKGRWIALYTGGVPRIELGSVIRYIHSDSIKKGALACFNAKYSALYAIESFTRPNVAGYWAETFGNYQYSALAEWMWNVKGRTIHQFDVAWATRHGLASPASFADWRRIMSPIEKYFLYQIRSKPAWLKAADSFKKNPATDLWIAGMANHSQMEKMLADCSKALPLAEKTENKSVILETKYLKTFLSAQSLFRALYTLRVSNDPVKKEIVVAREKLTAALKELLTLTDTLVSTLKVNPQAGPAKIKREQRKWLQRLIHKTEGKVDN